MDSARGPRPEPGRERAVASGRPYAVSAVGGHPPAALEDFLGDGVVAITIADGDRPLVITGSSRRDGEDVVLYEKGCDGAGKDVRTWRIRWQDGHFEAVERAIF
jgi:hypothetical protein